MSKLDHVLEVFKALLITLYASLIDLYRLVVPQVHKDVKDDVILVTGGGSGIGRLMCCKLARKGAIIVTWDINTKGNEETVNMIKSEGGKAYAYTVDMSNRNQIYEMAVKVGEEVGPVQILVNNAGIVSGSTLLNTSDQKIIRTFDVNVMSHFWTIKAFLPSMIEARKGHLVNIASLAGQCGINKLVDYCSSKFAAVGLDEALRVELFCEGHSDYIKTTCVCPYYINTGMFSGVQSKLIPILEPEDVAESAVAGILTDKEIIILPAWTCMLLSLKAILPPIGFLKVSQAFGFNCSMDQFVGRAKNE